MGSEMCIRDSVLINNAGINRIDRLEDINSIDFEEVLKVNLKGPFYLSKFVSRKMLNKGGRIVNIASIWSKITREGRTSYVASKAGLDGITRATSVDLAGANILVNTVSPGFTLTDLTRRSLTAVEMQELVSKIPLGRMAETEEVAELVAFLASDKNTYITGQNIVIDGGFTNV